METQERTQTAIHWEYYLGLEANLLRAARFVDFSAPHLSVHSQYFTQMLVSAASEFECVSKAIASVSEFAQSCDTIEGIKPLYMQKEDVFCTCWLQVLIGDQHVRPFADWDDGKQVKWWRGYNKVKHERHINMKHGSLENAIYAMGGLYLVNLALSSTEGGYAASRVINSPSQLFAVSSIHGSTKIDFYTGTENGAIFR